MLTQLSSSHLNTSNSFQSILVRGYPYPLEKKNYLQLWMNQNMKKNKKKL